MNTTYLLFLKSILIFDPLVSQITKGLGNKGCITRKTERRTSCESKSL